MKLLIKTSKLKHTEHTWELQEQPKYIGLDICINPKKVDTGCGGCKKEVEPDSIHICTMKLERKIHPCYKDLDPCYGGGYYDINKENQAVDLSGCKEC